MEESKALSKLSEANDLLSMIEEILSPSSIERLSHGSWSGVRLTLKNARSMLQESQNTLSKEFVARARNSNGTSHAITSNKSESPLSDSIETISSGNQLPAVDDRNYLNNAISNPISAFDKTVSDQTKVQITRRDLKASLEKFIESR